MEIIWGLSQPLPATVIVPRIFRCAAEFHLGVAGMSMRLNCRVKLFYTVQ